MSGARSPYLAQDHFVPVGHRLYVPLRTVSGLPALEHALRCLVSEGHVVVVGPPRTGKSTLLRALADTLEGEGRTLAFVRLPEDEVVGPGRLAELLALASDLDAADLPAVARALAMRSMVVVVDEYPRLGPHALTALSTLRDAGVPFALAGAEHPVDVCGPGSFVRLVVILGPFSASDVAGLAADGEFDPVVVARVHELGGGAPQLTHVLLDRLWIRGGDPAGRAALTPAALEEMVSHLLLEERWPEGELIERRVRHLEPDPRLELLVAWLDLRRAGIQPLSTSEFYDEGWSGRTWRALWVVGLAGLQEGTSGLTLAPRSPIVTRSFNDGSRYWPRDVPWGDDLSRWIRGERHRDFLPDQARRRTLLPQLLRGSAPTVAAFRRACIEAEARSWRARIASAVIAVVGAAALLFIVYLLALSDHHERAKSAALASFELYDQRRTAELGALLLEAKDPETWAGPVRWESRAIDVLQRGPVLLSPLPGSLRDLTLVSSAPNGDAFVAVGVDALGRGVVSQYASVGEVDWALSSVAPNGRVAEVGWIQDPKAQEPVVVLHLPWGVELRRPADGGLIRSVRAEADSVVVAGEGVWLTASDDLLTAEGPHGASYSCAFPEPVTSPGAWRLGGNAKGLLATRGDRVWTCGPGGKPAFELRSKSRFVRAVAPDGSLWLEYTAFDGTWWDCRPDREPDPCVPFDYMPGAPEEEVLFAWGGGKLSVRTGSGTWKSYKWASGDEMVTDPEPPAPRDRAGSPDGRFALERTDTGVWVCDDRPIAPDFESPCWWVGEVSEASVGWSDRGYAVQTGPRDARVGGDGLPLRGAAPAGTTPDPNPWLTEPAGLVLSDAHALWPHRASRPFERSSVRGPELWFLPRGLDGSIAHLTVEPWWSTRSTVAPGGPDECERPRGFADPTQFVCESGTRLLLFSTNGPSPIDLGPAAAGTDQVVVAETFLAFRARDGRLTCVPLDGGARTTQSCDEKAVVLDRCGCGAPGTEWTRAGLAWGPAGVSILGEASHRLPDGLEPTDVQPGPDGSVLVTTGAGRVLVYETLWERPLQVSLPAGSIHRLESAANGALDLVSIRPGGLTERQPLDAHRLRETLAGSGFRCLSVEERGRLFGGDGSLSSVLSWLGRLPPPCVAGGEDELARRAAGP